MNKIDTIKYKDYLINIFIDGSIESPRVWDNVGIMELTYNRYNLPSEGGGLCFDPDYYEDAPEDLQEGWDAALYNLKREKKPLVVLPVVGYDHGGLAISIGESFDRWDGGRLGFIYTTREKLYEAGLDYGLKDKKKIIEILKSEVKTYNQYLTGDVYGYNIEDADGETSGGCWGFYGHDHQISGLLDEAKTEIDAEINERATDKSRFLQDLTSHLNAITARVNKYTANDKLTGQIKRNIKSIQSIINKNI